MDKKTPIDVLELLEEKIDVRQLISKIEFSEDDLMTAAFNQPKLFWDAGRYRVQQMHKRARVEMQLELAKADAGLKFRRIRDDKGRKEHTESAVKERIELAPDVRVLRKKVDREFASEELAKMLVDTYRMRRDVLRIIIDAGKISLHAKELELLRGSKKLSRAVHTLRERWKTEKDEEE